MPGPLAAPSRPRAGPEPAPSRPRAGPEPAPRQALLHADGLPGSLHWAVPPACWPTGLRAYGPASLAVTEAGTMPS